MSKIIRVIMSCHNCGHRNRPHRTVRESIRLWFVDELPPCKKCKQELKKDNYSMPPRAPYVKMFEKQYSKS